MRQVQVAKFQISDILPIALTFVILGVGMAIGLNIMSDVKSDFVTNTAGCNSTDKTNCGMAYNATVDSQEGVNKIASKLPLIATAVVFAVLIGVLLRYIYVRGTK